jgi:hypothetical protein
MKTRLTLLLAIAFAFQLWGQGACPQIQFTYDAAGNRVKRQFITCFQNGGGIDTAISRAILKNKNDSENPHLTTISLNAYPNPNNGVFDIVIDNPQENGTLEMYDFTGRKIWSQAAPSGKLPMNAHHWAAGAYMIVYRDPQKILGSLKVIIE